MATIHSSRPRGDEAAALASTAALRAQLRSDTDLTWLVVRVIRHGLPSVAVTAAALRAWEERDPAGWAKVSAWLAANGIAVVRV